MTYRLARIASCILDGRLLSARSTSPPLDSGVFAEQLYDAVVAVPLDELGDGTTHYSAIGHVSASD